MNICWYRLFVRLLVKALPLSLIPMVSIHTQAQDPVFSQFYSAPLELNPAFAGSTEGGKIGLNYRNQWPRINQAYVTYAASYDQLFPFINSGFGISILADNAGRGLYKTTDVSLFYAYVLRVDHSLQIRFGVEAGFINSRVDWSRLVFLDQLDPEFGPISPGGLPYPSEEIPPEAGTSLSVVDISMGLLVFNETFYAGLALKHMNAPEFSFLNVNTDLTGPGLPMRISAHGGAEFDVLSLGRRGSVFVAPGIQYIRQGDFSQLNV
ncbi:MAG: PorP/SprF family type IX secretion system membrane protein, partial [Saprospiraceae bacterium]|nr:PorP/SprF family type IX secretion system membrane protein [Saprospiraceae bacterium]